ncbi:hypothetical protein SNEBB_006409 [Seison nebaliae]|nr:hypothetical protein SNEBB_006409 [Seison nebaliae]
MTKNNNSQPNSQRRFHGNERIIKCDDLPILKNDSKLKQSSKSSAASNFSKDRVAVNTNLSNTRLSNSTPKFNSSSNRTLIKTPSTTPTTSKIKTLHEDPMLSEQHQEELEAAISNLIAPAIDQLNVKTAINNATANLLCQEIAKECETIEDTGDTDLITDELTSLLHKYSSSLLKCDRKNQRLFANCLLDYEIFDKLHQFVIAHSRVYDADFFTNSNKKHFAFFWRFYTLTLHASNASDDISAKLGELDYVQLLVDNLSESMMIEKAAMKKIDPNDQQIPIIRIFLGILHNLAKLIELKEKFQIADAVEELLVYTNNEEGIDVFRTLVYMILAYIIDEWEKEKLMNCSETINHMGCLLHIAVNNPKRLADDRLGGTLSAEELADSLHGISIYDENKLIVAQNESIINSLTNMVQNFGDFNEQLTATKTLWRLTYNEAAADIIRNNKALMAILKNVKRNTKCDPELKKMIDGIFWQMDDVEAIEEQEVEFKNKRKKKRKKPDMDSGFNSSDDSTTSEEISVGHIMLSYNGKSREKVKRIKFILNNEGIKTWMDIDNMTDNSIQAMAEAVENCSIFLMCFTEAYKCSDNCRAEAEYARECHKPIIPLLMQAKYKADGWLGFLLGSKIYVDASGKYAEGLMVKRLMKQIDTHAKAANIIVAKLGVKIPLPSNDVKPNPSPAQDELATKDDHKDDVTEGNTKIECRKWNANEVQKWTASLPNCAVLAKIFGKMQIDGIMLEQIVIIKRKSPETIFNYMKIDQKMDLRQILSFFAGLDTLKSI